MIAAYKDPIVNKTLRNYLKQSINSNSKLHGKQPKKNVNSISM